ncbi:MAG: AAA family ATPase [candidate division NC10 bacterium]|nr:AAA family ATPase [candidate division NC10 bacterium]
MPGRVVLPQLLAFRLRGFQPVFKRDVSFALLPGYNLILGGNAMGKTTLMQAIAYGLTGGSEQFETNKDHRWSHSYFHGRLARGEARNATIEVEFSLGAFTCEVRRGFAGNHVTAFRANRGDSWIDDKERAGAAFENFLLRYGHYASVGDFAFVVHRLLYLPESRRLLAWDSDAQVRLLMVLNQDLVPERNFHDRRNLLQRLDTKKRHIRVAINKTGTELARLMEYDETAELAEETETAAAVDSGTLTSALREWQRLAGERARLERELQSHAKNLDSLSREIEALQEEIDGQESAVILRLLGAHERETRLPLQKLVDRGICPACGTEQRILQGVAVEHLRHSGCALCGSAVVTSDGGTLTTLHSRMSEKLSAQQALQDTHAGVMNRLNVLQVEEQAAQTRLNELRFAQPVVTLAERHLPLQSQQNLREQKTMLERQELDLEAQIARLTRELDEEYRSFRQAMATRTEQLRQLYTNYATAFLGLPCELVESASSDNCLRTYP